MNTLADVVNYALGSLVLFLVSWRVLQFIVAFTARELRYLGKPK